MNLLAFGKKKNDADKILFVGFQFESDHGTVWVEKDHNDHLVSTPLLRARLPTTTPGCPEPQGIDRAFSSGITFNLPFPRTNAGYLF